MASSESSDSTRFRRLALIALAVAALLATWLFHQRLIPQSSDTAIVALEAQDILYRGARPVFYPGSDYAGAFQPYLLAAAFRFLPDAPVVQFLVGMAMFLGVGAMLLHVTRRVFGPRAVLGAAIYFALGPFYLYYRALLADGPYQPTFFLNALALLLLVELAVRNDEGRGLTLPFLLLGATLGLAWWTHPLALASGAAAAAAMVAGSWWRRLRPLAWIGAALLFFAASSPWWVRNLSNDFLTLRGHDSASATLDQVARQLTVFWDQALPLFAGFGRLNRGETAPLGWSLAGAAWLVGLIATFIGSGRRESPSTPAREAFGLFALLQPTFALAIALSSIRGTLSDPRFVYPIFFFVIPVVGALCARVHRRSALLLGVTVVGLHTAGFIGARPDTDWSALAERIETTGVRGIYSDYFVASMITFETQGRVVGTPFGRGTVVRRAGDRSFVDALDDPGFVLVVSDARRLERFAARYGAQLRASRLSPSLVLVHGLPIEALAILRGCYCVPSGLGGEAVSWGPVGNLPTGWPEMSVGQRMRLPIEVANRGDLPWTPGIYLSYHWTDAEGRMVVHDGLRSGPPHPLLPGESARVELDVEAPVLPGHYQLALDAVEEGVTWFSALGAPGPRLAVTVR